MSNHSVIEHCANYHYARLEEDYILICMEGKASPHCKALILSILEQWTNTKRDNEEDPIIYMTYPLWTESMYCMFGRNVIINSLQELEDEGLIKRHPFITSTGKDSFAYTLEVQTVQEKLKTLPAKESTRPNLNAFKNKRVPNQTRLEEDGKTDSAVYFQTGNAFKKGRNVTSITQLPNITSDNIPSGSSSDSPDQPLVFGKRESDTVLDGGNKQVLIAQETTTKEPSQSTEKPKKQKTTSKKPATSQEEKDLRVQVQEWVDRRRTYKLYGRATKDQIFAERNAVDALAHMLYLKQYENNDEDGCTWKQLDFVWTYIATHDSYWSLPDNKDRIGAYAILQKFAQVAEKMKQKKVSGNSVSGHQNLTFNRPTTTTTTVEPASSPQEHPGPAPRRLRFRRLSDIQAAIDEHHDVVAQ